MEKDIALISSERVKSFFLLAPVVLVLLALAHFLWDLFDKIVSTNGVGGFLQLLSRAYSRLWTEFFGDPYFYLGIPVIVLLQLLIPIENKRSLWNVNTRIDFLYAVFSVVFVAICAPLITDFLRTTYGSVLGSGVMFKWPEVPMWGKIIAGYLAIDFLGWFHHLVRHKVPFFWRFHAVHHSQKKMNIFSNQRFHPMDWMFAVLIKFVPAYMATNSLGLILGYIAAHRFLDRLNHSNVRSNFGLLRYIFVTPQSHHVHHSCDPRHFDTNFGVSLSIWDHIFGTQYRDYNVYPETGIPDTQFPCEQENAKFTDLLRVFVRQLAYPFGGRSR